MKKQIFYIFMNLLGLVLCIWFTVQGYHEGMIILLLVLVFKRLVLEKLDEIDKELDKKFEELKNKQKEFDRKNK
ncbi:MAG: hypothetical protein ACTSQG_00115 [Promethearchaeota archaeon]